MNDPEDPYEVPSMSEPPAHDEAVIEWKAGAEPKPTTVMFEGARVGHFDVGKLFCEVLELRFGGEYRHGSRGTPDADAMAQQVASQLLRHEPDVVLLDLRALHYAWGDGMVRIFEVIGRFDRDYPLGVVVLAGPGSLAGLRSLCTVVHDDPVAALDDAMAQAVRRSFAIG